MRFKQVGNKYDAAMIVAKNNSATITIPAGAPVYYSFNGTDDGLAVLNANAAGTAGNLQLFAGVTPVAIPPGGFQEVQVYGFCQTLRVIRQVRATSTDSFSTASAISVGDILTVRTDSTYDGFTDIYGNNFTGTLSQTVTGVGTVTSPFLFNWAIAAQSLASAAASASSVFGSTSSGSLVVATNIKAFLRAL